MNEWLTVGDGSTLLISLYVNAKAIGSRGRNSKLATVIEIGIETAPYPSLSLSLSPSDSSLSPPPPRLLLHWDLHIVCPLALHLPAAYLQLSVVVV